MPRGAEHDSTSLQPLDRERVSQRVTKIIRDYIDANKLTKGAKLPSERELATQLNVGSRSIREALQNLQSRGIVRIEHGRGTFVDEKYGADYANFIASSLEVSLGSDQKLLIDLANLRKLIESGVVADAASSRNPRDLERLSKIIDAMEQAQKRNDRTEYNDLDIQFHKAIIAITRNQILMNLYDRLNSLFVASFTKTGSLWGSLPRSLREHKKIFEYISSGDPRGARSAIVKHIDNTARSLTGTGSQPDAGGA